MFDTEIARMFWVALLAWASGVGYGVWLFWKQITRPTYTPPVITECRACVFVALLKSQSTELRKAWAQLEDR